MFRIEVSRQIFTEEEISILERFGHELQRLMIGDRKPTTPAQKRFVLVCRDEELPQTKHETAWWKYIKRREWESDPANKRAMGASPRPLEGFGGSIEDWKRMRAQQWVTCKNVTGADNCPDTDDRKNFDRYHQSIKSHWHKVFS